MSVANDDDDDDDNEISYRRSQRSEKRRIVDSHVPTAFQTPFLINLDTKLNFGKILVLQPTMFIYDRPS